MRQTVFCLIQVFQKMLETEIKQKFLIEIYKEFLRGQAGLAYIIFWRLMKILWQGNMDQTVFSFKFFLPYPSLEK